MAMSEAMKKVDQYRDAMNKGRVKIMAKDFSCVVYFYDGVTGKPCVIGYKARSKKSNFQYRYGSTEARSKHVSEWMKTIQSLKPSRRSASERALKEGDVLRCSWGYDQTNIDYYLVTKLIGKTMVEIVKIGYGMKEETEWMQGKCVPDKTKIIGEPIRKKANGEGVSISSLQWARKIDPKIVSGTEIYDADQWTAYH